MSGTLTINGNEVADINSMDKLVPATPRKDKIMFHPIRGEIKVNGKTMPEFAKFAFEMKVQYEMEYARQRKAYVMCLQGVREWRATK
jgi:hypothetical protein